MEGETLRLFIRDFVNTPGHYNRLIAGTAPKRLADGAKIVPENPKEISDVRRMNATKTSASKYRTTVGKSLYAYYRIMMTFMTHGSLLVYFDKKVKQKG